MLYDLMSSWMTVAPEWRELMAESGGHLFRDPSSDR